MAKIRVVIIFIIAQVVKDNTSRRSVNSTQWKIELSDVTGTSVAIGLSNMSQTLSAYSQSETKRMRNRNTRRGNTGRNTSSRSAPKKDSKPDKSKGLANRVFSSGKSEDFQKTHEYLMSHIRLQCDNGDDIVTAMENGKPCDFSKEMPTMKAQRDSSTLAEHQNLMRHHDGCRPERHGTFACRSLIPLSNNGVLRMLLRMLSACHPGNGMND